MGSQLVQWAAGSKIPASSLLAMEPQVVFKGADTQRASTTTVASDPDLSISGLAAGTYVLEGLIVYSGAAINTGDLKITVTATSGSVLVNTNWWGLVAPPTTGVNNLQGVSSTFGTSFAYGTPGTNNNLNGALRGVFQAGVANTAITVQWAQNTSNATATTLRAGSWMSIKQIA
jgi:hypothetical protein